eukprot:TRINITY_DN50346_c0_g1_i1.p1 TRINITY_DN50346_c0_g1~~TRINITY_DN50346_c0_g1_i1.p1  ORF type:complete len:915 (+),score=273.65 TRINITY_DN50346_c0_g1_i1:101-2845(+)
MLGCDVFGEPADCDPAAELDAAWESLLAHLGDAARGSGSCDPGSVQRPASALAAAGLLPRLAEVYADACKGALSEVLCVVPPDGAAAMAALQRAAELRRVQEAAVPAELWQLAKSWQLCDPDSCPALRDLLPLSVFRVSEGAGGRRCLREALAASFAPVRSDLEMASCQSDGGEDAIDMDEPAQLDLRLASRLGELLHVLGIRDHTSTLSLALAVAREGLHARVRRSKGRFTSPQLARVRAWADNHVSPWLDTILGLAEGACGDEQMNESDGFAELVQRRAAVDNILHAAFIRQRGSEFFEIVIDYPNAKEALIDLRCALTCNEEACEIFIRSARAQIERRLVHAAAKTEDIVVMFMSAMHTVNALFPGEYQVINAITAPVQVCLSQRRDGLAAFTRGLINDPGAPLADLLHPELRRGCERPIGPAEASDSDEGEEEDARQGSGGEAAAAPDEPPEDPIRVDPGGSAAHNPRWLGAAAARASQPRAESVTPAHTEQPRTPRGQGSTPGHSRLPPLQGADGAGALTFSTSAALPSFMPRTPLRTGTPVRCGTGQPTPQSPPPGHVDPAAACSSQPLQATAQPHQQPPQTFRWKRRRLDVLRRLVDTFGGRDAVVGHYRELLRERLIGADSFDSEEDLQTLEFLKLRFGDTAMQSCEVMLKDVSDSKRICHTINAQQEGRGGPEFTALVTSKLYWPAMSEPASESAPFRPHPVVAAMQKAFLDGYKKFKAPRTLVWLPTLGHARLRIRLRGSGEEIVVRATIVRATVLLHVCDASPRGGMTLEQLGAACGGPQGALQSAVRFWVGEGLLEASGGGAYSVVSRRVETRPLQADAGGDGAAAGGGGGDSEAGQAEQIRDYVEGMLQNFGALPAPEIHNMLKQFLPDYSSPLPDLVGALGVLVADGTLQVQGGQYSVKG